MLPYGTGCCCSQISTDLLLKLIPASLGNTSSRCVSSLWLLNTTNVVNRFEIQGSIDDSLTVAMDTCSASPLIYENPISKKKEKD